MLNSYLRGATATKASKARDLPNFWVTFNNQGADYIHHSNMGLVWLKFAVAPLYLIIFKAPPVQI